jgi:hypothetical protein
LVVRVLKRDGLGVVRVVGAGDEWVVVGGSGLVSGGVMLGNVFNELSWYLPHIEKG